MTTRSKSVLAISCLVCLLGSAIFQGGFAQDTGVDNNTSLPRDENGNDVNVVTYARDYFDRYQPLTALDMVRQVPGFQLVENDSATRGYSEALGNLLINDRRPSAKQDQPLDILARIPAELVVRIELIRGQLRDIDMQGQSRLINVVLHQDAEATLQWDAYLRQTFRHGRMTPKVSFSLTDNWQETDYNVGLGYRRSRVGDKGSEAILDGQGKLTETRFLNQENRNTFISANLSASRWLGQTFAQLNSSFVHVDHRFARTSRRIPEDPGSSERVLSIKRNFDEPVFELGFDLERSLLPDLTGKLIVLFFHGYEDAVESSTTLDSGGAVTLVKIADTYNVSSEGISRFELDWTGVSNHALQLNLEAVYNLLNGKFSQTDNDGSGAAEIEVPGANSRVEELRGDILLLDTWERGLFELNFGLGAEVSRLTQTGDVENERKFFFVKPQATLSWSPARGQQTRIRLAREVAQLNLEDFISATVFEDNDLALGNPDIRPDTSWITEISHERRFTRDSVVKLTAFHHWIADVLDLLPLSSTFEAPGNIGAGRRWGLELESTVPLQWLGLKAARLKLKGRWQDSTVTDPVTGERRVLSAIRNTGPNGFFNVENEYAFNIDFRQDFQAARWAWGFVVQDRAERPRYKVNELEINDEEIEFNSFIETTRWLGIKMRIDYENISDNSELRNRIVYTGERDRSAIRSREYRDQGGGPRIFLTFSGTL